MAKAKEKRQRPSEAGQSEEPEKTMSAGPAASALPQGSEEEMPPEEVVRILQTRAQMLAQKPTEGLAGTTAEVVVFTLGSEVYGIEAVHVENIYPLEGLTPIPCTPDFVIGVVNLRGRIFSVVDLHRFMGLDNIAIDENTHVIAVSVAGLDVGILATDVRSVGPMALDKLEPALPTVTHIAAEYTRGVTPDMIVLLNLEALMRDRRMVVHEEV